MTQLAGRFSRFEHVLSSALLLSDVAATSGDRVGLIAFDEPDSRVRAAVDAERRRCERCASTLSGLDATLTEPDYASAFRMLATRQRRRALVVFFTDVIDVRAAQAVRRLRRSRGAATRDGHRRDPERSAARGGAADERRDRSRSSQRRGGRAGARARGGAGAHASRRESRCSTCRRRAWRRRS